MATLLLLLGSAAIVPAAEAQTLRERIRERIEERRNQPATQAPDAAAKTAAPLAPGDHQRRLDHGGLQRRYLIHVPPGLDPTKPAALLLAFHGGGGYAEYMADDSRYGLLGQADRSGFVVVFPNGYSRFPGGRLATWNAGGCCGDARDKGIDDVGFVRAIVADVQARVTVDPQRIFATGMSNGGMMAYRLACEAADVFRAVAAVAGTEAVAQCRPSRPVAILHIHARNDTHVLFNGGAGPDAFRDTAKVMDFVAAPETVSRWAVRNQCVASPQRVLEVPGGYCERYSGCRSGSPVQLCVTESGGHSWPGARTVRPGKEAASQALDANEQMWSFFAELPPRP
jgi:polyhydroxybutyrate depolymerase